MLIKFKYLILIYIDSTVTYFVLDQGKRRVN